MGWKGIVMIAGWNESINVLYMECECDNRDIKVKI